MEDEVETNDIYFAAYLIVSGCTMIRKRQQGPRRYFVFTNPGGSLTELRDGYYANSATVKANQYAQQIISMKQLCFD